MTPRVWMNKLNGEIVIAWPVIAQTANGRYHLLGFFVERSNRKERLIDTKDREQFYDIGEW